MSEATVKPLGGRFVLVTADELAGGQAKFHVSISVGSPDELAAEELQVAASAGGAPLEQVAGPPPGPLPSVEAKGITAFAQYTFANPGDQAVAVTVTLGGESGEFQLGSPAVA